MARRPRGRGHRPAVGRLALATSACEIITELMGEIQAARIIGTLASVQPAMFPTAQPHFIVRSGIGGVVLALRKFDDLWTHQVKTVLLPRMVPAEGTDLHRTLERKRFRRFCDRVVAHYSEEYVDLKTPPAKIEELLRQQVFGSDLDFFRWTSGVLDTLEKIRAAIGQAHGVDASKWKS